MTNKNVSIVLAEDDYLVNREIIRILRDSRYTVIGEARNGEEAVKMATELNPDAVLMDIKMPIMDGLEASRQIAEQHPLPVVILTAFESAELIEQASKAGVASFLSKPPKYAELDRAVTIAIARHQDLMEMHRLNQNLKKAFDEIKTLKGVLPICSKCKKIRNDEGYWKQVEEYISENSDAVFSHGICKQCADQLYGGQDWYEK